MFRRWASAVCSLFTVAICVLQAGPAAASPWVEVGDAYLRRDIETLAAYRLIDGLVTTWPIPWAQVARAMSANSNDYPPVVREALSRVRQRYAAETQTRRFTPGVTTQFTNKPPIVRGFGDSVYDEVDASVSGEYMWDTTAARLSVGYLSRFDTDRARVNLHRSYLAQELDNWLLYAGTLQQWWGPGNISSLILSNNARPFPFVGIMRNNPKAFETPWLSWIGPWQINLFGGLLDDRRTIEDVVLLGQRLSFNPIPGLEIGINQTVALCGTGIRCNAGSIFDALIYAEGQNDSDNTADHRAGADIRYTMPIGPVVATGYGQYTGEDQRSGLPNKAGWVLGASFTGASQRLGGTWQVIFEASDSMGKIYSSADVDNDIFYNGVYFPEGYRYRSRALGHSLDNDLLLFSVQASLTDAANRSIFAAYHRAKINRDDSDGFNQASQTAENVNVGRIGVAVPWWNGMFNLQLTLQDDQPNSPGEKDFLFSVLGGWSRRW